MPWSFDGSIPIYTQLITRLKQSIVSGVYPPGGRLPSVRELAQEAGVNPNTAQRAFAELERDGLISTQRTTGKYVTEDAAAIEKAKKELASRQIAAFLSAMCALGYSAEEAVRMLKEEH